MKNINNMNVEPTNCPHCNAPTLDVTPRHENCINCGYWVDHHTGEGWKGNRYNEKPIIHD